MDWKKETIEELRKHGVRRAAVGSLRQKIDILETDFGRLKAVQSDRSAVQGGGSAAEDRLINNLMERDRLTDQLQITKAYIRWMDTALRQLSAEEKTVLEYFFIDRPEDYIDQLCERLGCEQAQVYRIKDRALRELAMRLYAAA